MDELDAGVIRRLADYHAVYRMFDHAGRLLYIGVTGRAGRRFDQHATKRWFPLVAMITLEWHATHAAARLAETRAIAAERPCYNVAGLPRLRRDPAPPRSHAKDAAQQPDVLGDVLKVFGPGPGQHWTVLSGRLLAEFPGRWAHASAATVSALCRDSGVPSVVVTIAATRARGCRRADVETAAANRILTDGGAP